MIIDHFGVIEHNYRAMENFESTIQNKNLSEDNNLP